MYLLQIEENALIELKNNLDKEYLISMEDYLDKKILPMNSNKFLFDSILDTNQEIIKAKVNYIDKSNYQNSK